MAVNHRTAPVTERQKVMLEVAVKLARTPEELGSTDLERLRDPWRFSDEDIWDIGAIVALFALSNRMAHLTDLRPNPSSSTWAADLPTRVGNYRSGTSQRWVDGNCLTTLGFVR